METYRQQLRRLARAMASPDTSPARPDLSAESSVELLNDFVDGNLEKRYEKLTDQLDFVAEAFADFPALIERYVRSTRLEAYHCAVNDSERMLAWMLDEVDVSPEQRDYIACQRARHRIEEIARSCRLPYVRFQEIASLRDTALADENADWRLYLNPVREWTRFQTSALVGDEVSLPMDVVLFADRGEMATAALEDDGRELVEELSGLQPCSFESWAVRSTIGDHGWLRATCRDLAAMGLIALG